jgi:TrmH family RNA methyltransferase
MTVITSRGNPRVRRWRELTRDARLRREQRSVLLEGSNLVSACLDAKTLIKDLIVSESGAERAEVAALAERSGKVPVVIADPAFRSIVDTEAPSGIAAEVALPASGPDLGFSAGCVLLDAIQDAGNVGAILRSAAAFGIADAVLGPGCADAWSPKVLRAAMGAHFAMHVMEATDLAAAIAAFGGAVLCPAPRGGTALPQAQLPGRVAWLFGAEGRGVSEGLAAHASLMVSIPMRGATESLNVAAAAAICFYEHACRGKAVR